MGKVERVYIRLYKWYAREEDALNVLRRGTPERFAPKTFYGAGSSRGQSILRDAGTSRGGLKEKFVPLCTQKGRRRKNIKRNRARGARFHLSHLYVFQGYMHFLQTLHSSGLKFDNQAGLVCRVWCANPTQNPSLCRVLRRSV